MTSKNNTPKCDTWQEFFDQLSRPDFSTDGEASDEIEDAESEPGTEGE